VILPARVATLCPEGCRCDIGGYDVICDSASLNDIPLIHLTDVRELWFIGSKIRFLVKYGFVSLTELERLYVARCELRTVELGAFNEFTELTDCS
jgi:hypothetical protein